MKLWNWGLIIAGAVMVLIEVALGGFAGFDLVLIGSAFILGGAAGMLFGSTTTGFIVAGVLCLAYIAFGRRYLRGRLTRHDLPTNTDALLGREGVVNARIARHEPGQVRVNQEIWRAELAPEVDGPLEPGATVRVVGVEGVTLKVR